MTVGCTPLPSAAFHIAAPDLSILLQDVLVDFVVTLMRTAAEESSKRGKLSVEDLIFLVRKVFSLLTALLCRCWAQRCLRS